MPSMTIIDSGLLIYSATTMLSGGEPILMPTVRQEIIRRFAKLCYALHKSTGNSHVMIACDYGPYHRSKYFSQWYAENAKYIEVPETTEDDTEVNFRYLQYDNAIHPVITTEEGVIAGKPLVVKAQKELLERIELGELQWTSVPVELIPVLPKYKQGRNKGQLMENLGITLEDYYSIEEEALRAVAGWLGAALVKIPGWEADDVMSIYCVMAPESIDKITICSRDKDWSQMTLYKGRSIEWINTMTGEVFDSSRAAELRSILRMKLISGDTSDAIKGLPKGAKGCYGDSAAAKVTTEEFKELQQLPEYTRNRNLILLPYPLFHLEDSYRMLKGAVTKPEFPKDTVALLNHSTGKETRFNACFVSEEEIKEMGASLELKNFLKKLTGDLKKNEDAN